MRSPYALKLAGLLASLTLCASAAERPQLPQQDQALLREIEIKPEQLMPLRLNTPIVRAGKAQAIICYADAPAWRRAAERIHDAVAAATGTQIEMRTADALSLSDADRTELILVGHLDNNRHAARLYHNFFVCLDVGYTGRKGYVIRSVHDPWGAGHNAILVGGSYAEGTRRAADAFAKLLALKGRKGELTLGRLLVLQFDKDQRQEPPARRLDAKQLDAAAKRVRDLFATPGRGRSGVAATIGHAVAYHRGGDLNQAKAYRAGLLALIHYYQTDPYINSQGLGRYDRDFRDSWTHSIAITWDLLEESGVFSDAERLVATHFLARLGLECVRYQRWYRPSAKRAWIANRNIVHNHNTFPALGVHFVGTYLKRHYHVRYVDDWLAAARGIFNGQKHCSKPLEDAASYQWLPLMHVMFYGMAQNDWTFFEEGHARQAAKTAIMVMDNAGYQAAFGDHSAYLASGGIGSLLERIAWRTRDAGILWGARRAASGIREHAGFNLGQPYYVDFEPKRPTELIGVPVARLPKQNYDSCTRTSYATKPNLPWEQTFDKLALRAGFAEDDEYLLLDGFGRGTHMHFDANAIIRFAAGAQPLLVDGEYIKNAPKYHNSLVILRDGQSQLTPAATGLRTAAWLDSVGVTRTFLTQYNGAEWERAMVWRPGAYLLVCDTVTAQQDGDFTLRCCWRPWGYAKRKGRALVVEHPPMTLTIHNGDAAALRLRKMKTVGKMPIGRLSQQVSRRLRKGESYRFVNVVAARKNAAPRVAAQAAARGSILVRHGDETDVVALGPGAVSLPGVSAEADALLLAPDRLAAINCRSLSAGPDIMRASAPVDIEWAPAAGRAVVLAQKAATLALALPPGAALAVGKRRVTANAEGIAAIPLPPGRTELRFPPRPMPAAVASAAPRLARASVSQPVQASQRLPAPARRPVWTSGGFKPRPTPVRTVKVSCPQTYTGRYGPINKLVDGCYTGSTYSVMWPAGVAPAITLELPEDRLVRRIVLREWHMWKDWGIGRREVEISSDGFGRDVRKIAARFQPAGEQRWGGNVNTLMALDVNQRGRQIRLTLTPANKTCRVYLAEAELFTNDAGEAARILALAAARLPAPAAVAGSDAGEIRALSRNGKLLWRWSDGEHKPIYSLACADVDGDGRDEVMAGAGRRLVLLDAQGRVRWTAEPPAYRGILSDVMTVFPAKLDGKRPAIVCGCRSWQYFAYDASGKRLWRHVIYAHSATVGYAADFDRDGKEEVVGGNAYYCLNIIDDNGRRLSKSGSFGPEQTAVAAADLNGDGRAEALAGTDGGDLVCFNAKARPVWKQNLGDRVARILVRGSGKAARIYAAAESAHIFCLDSRGKILWRRALPDGASDMAPVQTTAGPRLVAAAGTAGAVALNLDGSVAARGVSATAAGRLVVVDGRVVVATDGGKLAAFDLP